MTATILELTESQISENAEESQLFHHRIGGLSLDSKAILLADLIDTMPAIGEQNEVVALYHLAKVAEMISSLQDADASLVAKANAMLRVLTRLIKIRADAQ